jgi:hypothetical protein
MLTRPRDRRVEQARDADPVWQSTFDGGFDGHPDAAGNVRLRGLKLPDG